MRVTYLHLIALLIIVCCIAIVIPVAASQSEEQSLGSMTRGSRFTVTITGLPNTTYYVWLPGTFTMTGERYDQPPVITDGTMNLQKDSSDGPFTIGTYQYNNGGGRTILDDVAPSSSAMSNTSYYAQVTTDSNGQALVEFQTSVYTGLRSYSVKVENPKAPDSGNLLIEKRVYSRSSGSRPMVNTPLPTAAETTEEQTPVMTTPLPEETLTQEEQTPVPLTPETPPLTIPETLPTTRKAPVSGAVLGLAVAIGCITLVLPRR